MNCRFPTGGKKHTVVEDVGRLLLPLPSQTVNLHADKWINY